MEYQRSNALSRPVTWMTRVDLQQKEAHG